MVMLISTFVSGQLYSGLSLVRETDSPAQGKVREFNSVISYNVKLWKASY